MAAEDDEISRLKAVVFGPRSSEEDRLAAAAQLERLRESSPPLFEDDHSEVIEDRVERDSIVGDVASDCTTLAQFAERGVSLDWRTDGLQFTLSPQLRLTARGLS